MRPPRSVERPARFTELDHQLAVSGPDDFHAFAGGPQGNAYSSPGGRVQTDDTYRSGLANCPGVLQTQVGNNNPYSHTEQKFAYDLMNGVRQGQVARGGNYQLEGHLPPCPNCHMAMMRAAQETGSDIHYSWGGNTITYNGKGQNGGVVVSGSTQEAGELAAAYNPTDNRSINDGGAPRMPRHPTNDPNANPWGYTAAPGAFGAYTTASQPYK